MPNFYLLTGCSGAGKSTVLEALSTQGVATIAEPGRRIVREEQLTGGDALPWTNPNLFVERALAMASNDLHHAATRFDREEPVFCDRGLVDAALALERMGGVPADKSLAGHPRYEAQVFLFAPWPDLYKTDAERQHSFDDAIEEFDAIAAALPRLGYTPILVPKRDVEARTQFILDHVEAA